MICIPTLTILLPLPSIVVSIAAILILSVIGGLFRSEHHSMVGTTKDPEDGKAVAGSVFAAVIVYVVRHIFVFSGALDEVWIWVTVIQGQQRKVEEGAVCGMSWHGWPQKV